MKFKYEYIFDFLHGAGGSWGKCKRQRRGKGKDGRFSLKPQSQYQKKKKRKYLLDFYLNEGETERQRSEGKGPEEGGRAKVGRCWGALTVQEKFIVRGRWGETLLLKLQPTFYFFSLFLLFSFTSSCRGRKK